jgi:hypothetical protein
MGEAKRNGATGRTLGCEERWVAAGIGMESGRYRNGKQKGATQTWCRVQKNAGRGRYRMGELRRNGATGRTQGCGRYKNRKRWRGDAGGTEVMGKARRKSATGRTVDCGKNRNSKIREERGRTRGRWRMRMGEDADGRGRRGEARRNGATGRNGLWHQRKAMARRGAEWCDGRMREARNGAT